MDVYGDFKRQRTKNYCPFDPMVVLSDRFRLKISWSAIANNFAGQGFGG